MELETANQNFAASVQPGSTSTAVRMIVLNNNQICVSVLRAASVVISLAFILQLVLRAIPLGHLKDVTKTIDIALLTTALGLFVLLLFLDRALIRCPVCRTRITSKTEEGRRCLNCNTALWD